MAWRIATNVIGNVRENLLTYVQAPLVGSFVIVTIIASTSGPDGGSQRALVLTILLTAVSIIALVIPWARFPRNWLGVVALVDLGFIALLRQELVQQQPGLSLLVIFPVLWMAYSFGIGALVTAIVGDYLVALSPFLIVGTLPASSVAWGTATLAPAVLSTVAIAVHVAARQLRRQTTVLVRTSEELRQSIEDGLSSARALSESRVQVADGLDAASTALAVVDTVEGGIIFYDPSGRILLSNETARAMSELAGAPSTTHVGAAPLVFDRDRVTPMRTADQLVTRAGAGELDARHFSWIGLPPHQRAVTTTSHYVRRASGEIIGTVLAFNDVTALAEAIDARDDFLTTISHELRTPLTSMIGYLEVIEDRVDAEAIGIAAELEIVQRNSQRLLALIADLLAVAYEPLKPERRMVDLAAIARLALENVRERATGAGLTVTGTEITEARAEVESDRISDLLAKLLSNAILFNRPGGDIAISVSGSTTEVVLAVSDTGIGISAEDQPHIFERFYRGSAAHAGVLAGVGLGLSMAQALVESHDGTITAASELGRGTTVTVRLPVHATAN
jgi:two-component system, OmpR family, phosphate regulon sensor histidine kinase PhoR